MLLSLPLYKVSVLPLLLGCSQFGQLIRDLANSTTSQVSAEPSPADEQQQISADSAGRILRDLIITKSDNIDAIPDKIYRRPRGFTKV
ncbi:hypothetical protein KM043_005208 [Ampulex compressa]|nr:hypothetical protein KM043_005208 [Ampulex compressa]